MRGASCIIIISRIVILDRSQTDVRLGAVLYFDKTDGKPVRVRSVDLGTDTVRCASKVALGAAVVLG